MSVEHRIACRYANQRMSSRATALMRFIAGIARSLGIAEHAYIVGGAPRNFLLDPSGQKFPIKDVDVVVDSIALGKDSAWFAQEVARRIPAHTNLTTNQYGVAILTIGESWLLDGLDMKGETIEIANARKESYTEGYEGKGKGYKPTDVQPATIEEDVSRREFTFNTLLWRLIDLTEGPDKAEIIDLTGRGRKDLEEGMIRTPVDPDKTFGDDPTRMLRAIKFIARYGFKVPPDVVASIRRNAPKLKRMPWDAVRKILVHDILEGPAPRKSLTIMQELGLIETLKELAQEVPPFANALSRSLSEAEAELLLDMMDLGFAFKTPISWLKDRDRTRLRQVLLGLPTPEAKAFYGAFLKPPIDQEPLFDRFQIPPKNRKMVQDAARQHMLDKPELALDPARLQHEVERSLSRQFGGS